MVTKLEGVKACVFDAYGTLFDVNAAAREEQSALGEKWEQISDIWRTKQLQYTWLRSLQGNYTSFWQVTQDALEFALASAGLQDSALRDRLMDLYLKLDAYEEVPETLRALKAAGLKTAILSNGSPEMLQSAVDNAGISDLLDGVYSVESVGVFKPHPSVYQLAVDDLDISSRHISFQSSNGWDAYSAKDFGFQTLWCNRFGQAEEQIPSTPDTQITNLSQMLPILGL
ncbi:MAG: haloacid dehalogenase type II [Sneathiella sp.]